MFDTNQNSSYLAKFSYKKIFGMPAASSKIPGFVIGDSDNDGKNEVIYNNQYVLKFNKDENKSLTCTRIDTIADIFAYGSVIGDFKPEGQDVPQQSRIIPIGLEFDLKKDQLIESGGIYKAWVKIQNFWGNTSNLKVRLESHNQCIKFKKSEIFIDELSSGKVIENKNNHFIFSVDEVDSVETFELDIILENETGSKLRQPQRYVSAPQNTSIILKIYPKLKINSNTLSIGHEKNLPKDMKVEVDYFNTDTFAWPSIDHIKKYKNLSLFDEWSAELYMTNS